QEERHQVVLLEAGGQGRADLVQVQIGQDRGRDRFIRSRELAIPFKKNAAKRDAHAPAPRAGTPQVGQMNRRLPLRGGWAGPIGGGASGLQRAWSRQIIDGIPARKKGDVAQKTSSCPP